MSGVNIFGEPLSFNKNAIQRGPAGIGFKYLDAAGNFDIDLKRLANVADPLVQNDAVNKKYLDKDFNDLRHNFDSLRTDQMNLMNMLEKNNGQFLNFISTHAVDKKNMEGKIRNIETYDSKLNERLTIVENKYLSLESNYQLTKSHFERMAHMLINDYITEDKFNDILTERMRIIDVALENQKIELSTQIVQSYDELKNKLIELSNQFAELSSAPKASDLDREENRVSNVSNRRKVKLDVQTNSGNINLLQNDLIDIKGELEKKNSIIAVMKEEVMNLKKRLEGLEIDAIAEGIEKNEGTDAIN